LTAAIVYSPDWRPHVELEVYALRQTNPGARIYLLSGDGGQLEGPGCEWVDIERIGRERFSRLNIDSRFTIWALYRLLLPEVIPEAKVLYLDADTLVTEYLGALWSSGLRGRLVAGVPDIGITQAQLGAIGHRPGDVYINAGVTLLDLDGIRAAGLPEVWMREINARHYSCHDQDVINKTCRGRIATLGNEYNSSLSTGFARTPKIAHYAGPAFAKPWVPGARPRHYELWHRWAQRFAVDRAARVA
jgi:lipopolysaccharide biosynthesis glycosyltransferase